MKKFFHRGKEKKSYIYNGEHDNNPNRFSSSGFLLFLNQLIIAFGNWIFWMFISRVTTTEAIGQSTTIVSLVLFSTTMIQLGLEYPILKYSYKYRNTIFATTLFLEIAISLVSIPLVIYFINTFYEKNLQEFEWLTIIMIMATAPGFVTHFLLLSMFKIRAVFIIDVLATIVKFGIGYALVVFGMGSFGIIVAFLGNIILTSLLSLLLVGNDLSFRLDLNLMRLFIAEGLVNTPSKISRILIFSLSIVLLASFGVNVSSIGIFYMALTMSLVVGGFATNIALMIIPSAAQSIKDYTSLGLRIGLSFTVPIIVLLTVGPELILGLIGYQYTVASLDLIILALAILPSSITITAISSLNTKDQHKKLLVIGIIEILSFILSFIILVPEKSTLGASLSTLIAFSVSATLSILWTGKPHLKYIMNSTIALAIGILFGYGLRSLFNDYGIYSVFNLFLPVIASTIVVFHLNEIKINEIIQIIKNVFNK